MKTSKIQQRKVYYKIKVEKEKNKEYTTPGKKLIFLCSVDFSNQIKPAKTTVDIFFKLS